MSREYLAIAEAHRTNISFERPFLHMLKEKGGFTPDLIEKFANEFMVARTLSWFDKTDASDKRASDKELREAKAAAKKQKLPEFSEFLNGLPTDKWSSLGQRFEQLQNLTSKNAVPFEMWNRRKFVSALTKFYMARTNGAWPPFDNYAAAVLGFKYGPPEARAKCYYEKLDELKFPITSDALGNLLSEDDGLRAERILDKYIIIKCFGIDDFVAAYAETQPCDVQIKWRELATKMKEFELEKWVQE